MTGHRNYQDIALSMVEDATPVNRRRMKLNWATMDGDMYAAETRATFVEMSDGTYELEAVNVLSLMGHKGAIYTHPVILERHQKHIENEMMTFFNTDPRDDIWYVDIIDPRSAPGWVKEHIRLKDEFLKARNDADDKKFFSIVGKLPYKPDNVTNFQMIAIQEAGK